VRILIAAVGSRGDVAPLTGLGTALRGAGHDVTVAAFGVFEELVTGCGLGFRLVPGDPQLPQASQQGQRWQEHGAGPASAIRFARLVAGLMRDVNASILQAARQGTDVALAENLIRAAHAAWWYS
jgi:sterol 3beta-glucosyltransferase